MTKKEWNEEIFEMKKDCLIIMIEKELDHHNALRIREQADNLLESGKAKHVIFDFQGVNFMDSSGIGMIMGRYKKVIFNGGKAAVVAVAPTVDRIFRMSGLYRIIEKFDTAGEAVCTLSKK